MFVHSNSVVISACTCLFLVGYLCLYMSVLSNSVVISACTCLFIVTQWLSLPEHVCS